MPLLCGTALLDLLLLPSSEKIQINKSAALEAIVSRQLFSDGDGW